MSSAYEAAELEWLRAGLQNADTDPFEKNPSVSGETILGKVPECLRRSCALHAQLKAQHRAETDEVAKEALQIDMATVDTLRRKSYHGLSVKHGQPISGRNIRQGGIIVAEAYHPTK